MKMLCVLKQDAAGQITGWMIAADVHEARRRAQSIGDMALAQELYRTEFPSPGKHTLGNGFTLLVD